MATGVRLITRVGDVINIDAMDFTMDFKRGVAVMPVPVLGERVAVDMNVVTASIRINAILRDDDCIGVDPDGVAAIATMDFGQMASSQTETETEPSFIYMTGDGGPVTVDDLDDKTLTLRTAYQVANTVEDRITIKFDSSTTSHSATSKVLTVGIQTVSTGVGLANVVYAAMTGHSGNMGSQIREGGSGSDVFGDAFSVTKTAGTLTTLPGGTDTLITITQKDAGISGNSDIKVWTDANVGSVAPFTHTDFIGGQSHTCKSAGDKAQDLVANVSNSNVSGSVGEFSQVGAEAGEHGIGAESLRLVDRTTDDYIVGIQIPYNSLVQATLGATGDPQQGYATRNHLLVTGMTSAKEQGSAFNNNASGIEFDSLDPRTGIRGTVIGLTLAYDAGQTIYDATIDFAPIDFIAGI